MTPRTARIDWLLFGLLGLLWGSSYLFIKIGVESLGPLTLVTLRCLFAAILLGMVVASAREPLPRNVRTVGHLAVLGVLSIFAPFVLIAWGETHVSSGLASVLNATTPLFTVVVAAVVLHDEPFRFNRVAGLVIGFLGVFVVASPTLSSPDPTDSLALAAQLAVVLASLSYALGADFARRFLRGLRPMTIAVVMGVFGFVYAGPLALALEDPLATGLRPEALLAAVWLGMLGSGVALLIFYRLLAGWGATRTNVVVYLMPPVGVALGVVFLHEPLHAALLAGTVFIVGGAALTNARGAGLRRSRSAPTSAE